MARGTPSAALGLWVDGAMGVGVGGVGVGEAGRRGSGAPALGSGKWKFWLHVRKMFSELHPVRRPDHPGCWVRRCRHGDQEQV